VRPVFSSIRHHSELPGARKTASATPVKTTESVQPSSRNSQRNGSSAAHNAPFKGAPFSFAFHDNSANHRHNSCAASQKFNARSGDKFNSA
jgi:hypothetical protein